MKEKFQIEYMFNGVTQNALWNMISTVQGLSQWFSSNVEIDEKDKSNYTFYWGKVSQNAKLINSRIGCYIRFRWEDDLESEEKPFFELRITVGELTNDIVLVVTDFAYPEDKEDSENLWNSQISNLKTVCGCDNI